MILCACGREAMPGLTECRECREDAVRHRYREEREVAVGRPVPKVYLSESKVRKKETK